MVTLYIWLILYTFMICCLIFILCTATIGPKPNQFNLIPQRHYTQYAASGTGLVGRYQNSGTCSMSVGLSVCMWDIDIKNFTVSH